MSPKPARRKARAPEPKARPARATRRPAEPAATGKTVAESKRSRPARSPAPAGTLGPEAVERLFRESGALLDGHFLLSSGMHASRYLQTARVLVDPGRTRALGAELASRLRPSRVEVIVAPALGGIVLGYEVARTLDVPFVFAERTQPEVFELRRGFSLPAGARVAVIEDVLTTRGSVSLVSHLVERAGGRVVAVAAAADRGPGGAPLPVEPTVLWRVPVESYPPEACPLCAAGAPPPVKPGTTPSRRERDS